MKKPLLFLAACALIAGNGCAAKRYSQFTGSQNWAVASQAMADNSYAVPVYHSWPDRPYVVIGSVSFAEPQNEWKDGDTAQAARMAKRRGGEAIIMRSGGEFGVGAIAGAAADARVVTMSGVTALVIKWKPQAEVEAEQKVLEQFYLEYKSKHPSVSRELVAMGAEYVANLGIPKGSPSWSEKLGNALDDVIETKQDAQSTKAFFKGTVQSEGITTSFTDVFFGVAKIGQSGASLTILSDTSDAPINGARHSDVNFSGAIDSGKVSGRLGFSSGLTIFSGKAEGVVVGNKILLNTQGQTASGIVQGSFTFVQ
jgi:hypothetical protein